MVNQTIKINEDEIGNLKIIDKEKVREKVNQL
jgi:hypothetical protein